MLDVEKSKTVCFTGHRTLPYNFDYEKLEKSLIKLVEKGYENFLIGMALGFDTACFILLDKIKRILGKKILATAIESILKVVKPHLSSCIFHLVFKYCK